MKKGFTLIELLVVISLIGVLAVALLSAINPVEQINKGRDAGRRADAAQIMGAIDRYYASNEIYPWNNSGTFTDYYNGADMAFKATGEKAGVGICGTAAATGLVMEINSDPSGCLADGLLIKGYELKSQFGKRKAFRIPAVAVKEDVFYVVKELSDPSVSVCFIPSSGATRTNWTKLKKVNLAVAPAITSCVAPAPTWADVATSCYVCIPEE